MICDVVVSDIGTNILVEPGISVFRLRRKELSYPEGEAAVPPNCFGLSTKPHGLYSQQTEVPITHHIPRFHIHEQESCRTALQIPRKICSKFRTSKNTW